MEPEFNTKVSIAFYGGDADRSVLNVYDYSRSLYGLARTTAILAEFYKSGRIIHKAPASSVDFFVSAAEQGSFKQSLHAAIVGGICVATFDTFLNRAVDKWLPSPDKTEELLLAEERKQTALLEQLLAERHPDTEDAQDADAFIAAHEKEMTVLRSITANSFVDIFRPVGRTAEYSRIFTGESKEHLPSKIVTPSTAAIIESDRLDTTLRTINARVTGFTRGTKRGVCFSDKLGHGFNFEYRGKEDKLPVRDIFSWSQYEQEDIILEGNFVYFFDGEIKKMIVYYADKAVRSVDAG
jgi:hypothetical protein